MDFESGSEDDDSFTAIDQSGGGYPTPGLDDRAVMPDPVLSELFHAIDARGRGTLTRRELQKKIAMGYATIAPINNILALQNGLNYSVYFGAQFHDGSVDGFSDLRVSTYQNGSTTGGGGAGAIPRVADTRFHDPAILSKYIYGVAAMPITVTIGNLTPGDTVTVTAVGSRNSVGTARRADVTLNGGETFELDAATDAASNQITFAPITVPASGELVLEMVVSSGSTYCYLNALALDFS